MPMDFADRAQLEVFDDLCIQFGRRADLPVHDCPALRLLHDELSAKGVVCPELSRRIAVAFEIKLGFLHTEYYGGELMGLENTYLVPDERRACYRPLDNLDSFAVALRRSRAAFGLVTRIRSLWDKGFLYVALTYGGDAIVTQLQSQRSKRKFFFSHFAAGFGAVTSETLTRANDALQRLERDFSNP